MVLQPRAAEFMTIRQINRIFRLKDESHLWPINNRFNVTDRAIHRLARSGIHWDDGSCYAEALDAEIGRIVNGEV